MDENKIHLNVIVNNCLEVMNMIAVPINEQLSTMNFNYFVWLI